MHMVDLNHKKTAPRGHGVVGSEPDFDPRWLFREVEAALRSDSAAVFDDTLSDKLEKVARHNSNPKYRYQAQILLTRWSS